MSDQYPRAPKLPKPMSDERLAEIRRAWFEEERIRTHYHGCYLAHAECALNVALAEVDRRGDELRSLRALLGVMHPEIVAVAAAVLAEELPDGWRAEVWEGGYAVLFGPDGREVDVSFRPGDSDRWFSWSVVAPTLAGIIEAVTQ